MDRYEALKQKVIDRKEAFKRFIALLEGETTWPPLQQAQGIIYQSSRGS